MKIAFKLPVSAEVSNALLNMPDNAAGAAIKALLAWMEGNEPGEVPAASRGVYEAIRSMVELSRKRASAGKAGGDRKRLDAFAASKPAARTPAPQETRLADPDDDDVLLAGLAMFQ